MRNRWVVLAKLIPWDDLCDIYYRRVGKPVTGRKPLNPRVVIGAIIIKHLCNLDDREAVAQMSENIYMQYFLGYPSFVSEQPFDASLFPTIRSRLGKEMINEMNERIVRLKTGFDADIPGASSLPDPDASVGLATDSPGPGEEGAGEEERDGETARGR
ncbi:MAG: transposase [Mediterranea sp.]|nr:transposase [Mediterranea sp.]